MIPNLYVQNFIHTEIEGIIMNKIKTILASAIVTVASFSSSASLINVGGVIWDPDHVDDFVGTAGLIHQDADANRSLSGYGVVTNLNGLDEAGFCPGCELEFVFGGYTISVADGGTNPIASPAGGISDSFFEYTGGWVNYYVDYTPEGITDVNLLTAANTGSGGGANLLWLSLEGAIGAGTETTFMGGPIFNIATGGGDFNVTGGAAAGNIDTNSILLASGEYADLSFGSTFSVLTPNGDGTSSSTGAATFSGSSIPEPTSLAIFGLALLAFGANARKKLL
jgi:hypothetical protein